MLPQIIFLLLGMLGLGASIANHGKPRSDENAWVVLLSMIISYSILYWGWILQCIV